MKNLLVGLIVISSSAFSQYTVSPVTWTHSTTQLSHKHFRFICTAQIAPGWRLYSQVLPEGARYEPTIVYRTLPKGTRMLGSVMEMGKRISGSDSLRGNHLYYENELVLSFDIATHQDSVKVVFEIEFEPWSQEEMLKRRTYRFFKWLTTVKTD